MPRSATTVFQSMSEYEQQSPEQAARPETLEIGGKEMSLEEATKAARNAAAWFWWIAGLSVINSIAIMLDSNYAMILGLGITQVFDGFLVGFMEGSGGDGAFVVRTLHVVLVALVVGFFVYLGAVARELRLWPYVVGMIAYTLDGLIFVLVSDWIAVGFHAFVLFMLWGGYGITQGIVKHQENQGASE